MNTTRATGFYGNGMKGMSRPKSPRSAYLGKRRAKTIGLLIVFAVVIVSGIALAPIGKEKASQPEAPVETTQAPLDRPTISWGTPSNP